MKVIAWLRGALRLLGLRSDKRVCTETHVGDLMVLCECGRLRPSHREHGWRSWR
jgi:hypothetical protein